MSNGFGVWNFKEHFDSGRCIQVVGHGVARLGIGGVDPKADLGSVGELEIRRGGINNGDGAFDGGGGFAVSGGEVVDDGIGAKGSVVDGVACYDDVFIEGGAAGVGD